MNSPSENAWSNALRCANYYRTLGLQPLPSKMDVKGPMLNTFADFWDKRLPDSVYSFESWRTTNIQIMCGAWPWRLCVVDCDGDEALEVWKGMIAHHGDEMPATWTVRTGGGGWHFYFTTPEWIDECPSRRLWGVWDTWAGPKHRGDWQKHKEVRLLGDRALVIAPPSAHVDTLLQYKFVVGPHHMPRPAEAPPWLMKMPAIISPACTESFTPPTVAFNGPGKPAGAFFRREEVLAAIPSKIDVARRWGLRVASNGPNPKGWWSVHAINRPDANPSASFHGADGVYCEGRDGDKLSLFDLAVALNAYPTWQEARDALGAEFLARPRQA